MNEQLMHQLQQWGADEANIRAMLLTSSQVHPTAHTDLFSDYDVVVFAADLGALLQDETWIQRFGTVLVRFNAEWIEDDSAGYMRLVLYADGLKIDFSLWPLAYLQAIAAAPQLPASLDAGYRILLDKDRLITHLRLSSGVAYIPTQPTTQDYQKLVSDFWWETTYVAKNLWRDDVFFAKYNLDYVIRVELLQPMLEWYIETQHAWTWQPGVFGKGLKQHVDAALWAEIESTFAGAQIAANWQALFNTTALFRKLAQHVAHYLQYEYPLELDTNVMLYLRRVQRLPTNASTFE